MQSNPLALLWHLLEPGALSDGAVTQVAYGAKYIREYVGTFTMGACLLVPGAWVLALCLGAKKAFLRFDWLERHSRHIVMAVAAFVVLVGGGIHYWVLAGVPHVQDEAAYRFQAEIFARGRLTAPAPPLAWRQGLSLEYYCPIARGKWFGKYFFAWPVLLAIGVAVGLAGWVNPLLNGLAILLLYQVTRQVADEKTALVVVALGAFSPFLLVMGASHMAHPMMLVLVCLSLLQHLGTTETHSLKSGAIIATLFGIALNVRPLTAVALIGPLLAHSVAGYVRRRQVKGVVLCLALSGVWIALALGFNWALTGDAWSTAFHLANPGDRLGFGSITYLGRPTIHSPQAGLLNLLTNVIVLNEDLHGLAGLSLLLPLLGLWRAFRTLPRPWTVGLGLLVVGHVCYWFPGTCFGARYYYAALPFLLISSAYGVETIVAWTRRKWTFSTAHFVLLLALVSSATYLPQRLAILPTYWGVFPDAIVQVRQAGVTRRVVLVDEVTFRTFFPLNGPFLDGENLYWNEDAGGLPPRDLVGRWNGGVPWRLPASQ